MAISFDNNASTLDEVIRVVGVGGGGGNAVNRMVDEGIVGVEYVVVNTDARALNSSRADNRVQKDDPPTSLSGLWTTRTFFRKDQPNEHD